MAAPAALTYMQMPRTGYVLWSSVGRYQKYVLRLLSSINITIMTNIAGILHVSAAILLYVSQCIELLISSSHHTGKTVYPATLSTT